MTRRIGTFNLLIALLLVAGSLTAASLEQVNTTSSQTLSNKTLTSPVISSPTFSGTASGTYTLGGTPTFSSPTLTNPTLSGTVSGTYSMGTPTGLDLANANGLPVSTGISGLGSGVATWLATPSSANLASAVTGETGSGALVFGTSPTISGLTLSGTPVFPDNVFTIGGSATSSKKLAFEVDGLSAATTRTLTAQDRNMTLGIVHATSQGSVSGTSRDFTGIPSGVRKVHVYGLGVSTNGTSGMTLRIGAGSVDTSGYDSMLLEGAASGNAALVTTAAVALTGANIAASIYYFDITFSIVEPSTNTWLYRGSVSKPAGTPLYGAVSGSKTLSGSLDRVRITTVNGTDTFDAGTVNIACEF